VRWNWDTFQATQSELRRKPIIPLALEEKFVECLLLIERKYVRCTRDCDKRLAFQLAVQNKTPSPFSIVREAAGKDGFKRCMQRHSYKLSLRQPSATSTTKATGFSKEQVGFFLFVQKRACCSWLPTFIYLQRRRNWFNSASKETTKNPLTQKQTSDWRFNYGIKGFFNNNCWMHEC
jgi:hypothetical protein